MSEMDEIDRVAFYALGCGFGGFLVAAMGLTLLILGDSDGSRLAGLIVFAIGAVALGLYAGECVRSRMKATDNKSGKWKP